MQNRICACQVNEQITVGESVSNAVVFPHGFNFSKPQRFFIHTSVTTLQCMNRELQKTADGSHTVAVPQLNVTYHSCFGAIQESRHVFIEAGLRYVLSHFRFTKTSPANVFEMGFGTGLNALLSLLDANDKLPIYYYTAELYPLSLEEAGHLNYTHQLHDETATVVFPLLHSAPWNEDIAITPYYTLHKQNISLLQMNTDKHFHLIYFDAFAPASQPELWTATVFQHMYNMLCESGVLVTYCSKGIVRRTLQSVGFTVEKLPGPPGQREMLRAIRRG